MMLPGKDELALIVAQGDYAKSRRSPHEPTWQDIVDLTMPFRGDFTCEAPEGSDRIAAILDTTAQDAGSRFTSFLKGIVIPSGTSWLKYSAGEFDDDRRVRLELEEAGRKMLKSLSHSNFYIKMGESIRDMVIIGNGTPAVREMKPRLNPYTQSTFGGFQFDAIPPARVWWTTGFGGEIPFILRELEIPAANMKRMFGARIGMQTMRLIEDGKPYALIKVQHYLIKNEDGIPYELAPPEKRPWRSLWVIRDADGGAEVIREGGFDHKIYAPSRYMVVDGEDYGRGIGHIIRPDAQGANELTRQWLNSIGMDLDPPIVVENERVMTLEVEAGGVVFTKPSMKNPPQFLTTQSNYQVAQAEMIRSAEKISRAFMMDLIRGKDTQPRSAEESRAEQLRAIQALSPQADIIEFELLGPTIQAATSIKYRAGGMPELDRVLDLYPAANIDINFVSPFFTAQKQSSVNRVREFVRDQVELAQMTQDPRWLNTIHPERAQMFIAENSDIPSIILKTPEEMQQEEEIAAEQAATQTTLNRLEQTAGIAKDAAAADALEAKSAGL